MARQPKPEEPKKGAPEFMSTYGDMVTLLLCFFVLLFAMSTVDAKKYEQITAALAGTPISVIQAAGSEGILEMLGKGIMEMPDVVKTGPAGEADEDGKGNVAKQEMAQMAADFQTYMAENNLTDKVEIIQADQYIQLRFESGMFFDLGRAILKQEAMDTLDKISDELRKYPDCDIRIEGHTDNLPISTIQFPNNLYLSNARAAEAGIYLIDYQGIDPYRVSTQGFGEYRPIDTNDTTEGRSRNRRVEIKIMSREYSGSTE